MRVSLNTIKQYIDFDLPPVDELVAKINAQLGGVEEVIDLGARYKDAVIVVVAKCEKHPNADRLNVCLVDDGGVVKDVERDEDNLIQVVCGASNVHGGMMAVWLPPKSIVPSTFDDKQPFVLETKELRGVMSNGMLASSKELAIGDDHEGIVEITEKDFQSTDEYSQDLIGKSFAEVFGLNDTIIDIENKMFTHRPDLFGQIGVAREIAGIQHKQFTSPEWYKTTPEFTSVEGLDFEISNDATENVPRFMAVAIKNIDVKPSPLWLQCELVQLGGKPINNIVDVTNYVMLLTAQPTHAYDYDKLRGHKLGTRMAKTGETTTLLNGKTYKLDESDVVIVDDEGIVGLGGVMGGENSEVSTETKNIVLEVATFDMYTVRKTSMRHGLFTDAVTRFNKGQSPLQNPYVLNLLMMSIHDVAGGEQASETFDLFGLKIKASTTLSMKSKFLTDRLKHGLFDKQISQLLRNVEIDVDSSVTQYQGEQTIFSTHGTENFKSDVQTNMFNITAPFWRTDIELPEDIVEEVGRLYGFDKLLRELPLRSIKPASKNLARAAKKRIRESLSRAGANEVLTYSFIHENVMKKAEQDSSEAFKLGNALSPDLQYYRLSVLPSLLDKVHANVKAGYGEFSLFEIGKGHNEKHHKDDDEGLPSELEFVDMVYASKNSKDGAAYYRIMRQVTQLLEDLGETSPLFSVIDQEMDFPVTAPFNQQRSAIVTAADGTFIGMIGELKQSVLRNFKLPLYTAAATLDMGGLQKISETTHSKYQPLSKFPAVIQDVSLEVPVDALYRSLHEMAHSVAKSLDDGFHVAISPVSIYQADGSSSKAITLRLRVSNDNHTLKDADVNEIIEKIRSEVQ